MGILETKKDIHSSVCIPTRERGNEKRISRFVLEIVSTISVITTVSLKLRRYTNVSANFIKTTVTYDSLRSPTCHYFPWPYLILRPICFTFRIFSKWHLFARCLRFAFYNHVCSHWNSVNLFSGRDPCNKPKLRHSLLRNIANRWVIGAWSRDDGTGSLILFRKANFKLALLYFTVARYNRVWQDMLKFVILVLFGFLVCSVG